MRLVLIALAAAAAWLLWRRRRESASRVHVAWRDGAELALGPGTPEHDRLVSLAGRMLG
jgi:hypothetical protein